MRVFSKLNTLFRAGVRESVESVTEANAIRIYRQEIIDAEEVLAQRRESLAATIATRRDLETDIERMQRRIARRTAHIQQMPAGERSEELLNLAATEIASWESEREDLKSRHVEVCESINREEQALRKLLGEIREHRREIKLLSARLDRQRAGNPAGVTLCGRISALRETRAAITGSLHDTDLLEAGMEEVVERLDNSPVDRKLRETGSDTASLKVNEVLNRLKGLPTGA